VGVTADGTTMRESLPETTIAGAHSLAEVGIGNATPVGHGVSNGIDAAPASATEAQSTTTTALQDSSPRAGTERQVATGLGGLFFLIPFSQYLGLYGDFTAPSEPGLCLDIWDFVTLLGRALLGADDELDAVWKLLAALARRRPEDPPGRDFEPPNIWRTPDDWLAPFESVGTWRYSTRAGRLLVEHPAGFVVLDRRWWRLGLPNRVRRELTEVGLVSSEVTRHRLSRPPRREPARWVDLMAAFARARLGVALGCPASAAAELLLRHAARVFVTPAHVDVVMSIARHPIEIRDAGLDRDPGWIPAAGRTVAFHFE
jgi:hypothetical protein